MVWKLWPWKQGVAEKQTRIAPGPRAARGEGAENAQVNLRVRQEQLTRGGQRQRGRGRA